MKDAKKVRRENGEAVKEEEKELETDVTADDSKH